MLNPANPLSPLNPLNPTGIFSSVTKAANDAAFTTAPVAPAAKAYTYAPAVDTPSVMAMIFSTPGGLVLMISCCVAVAAITLFSQRRQYESRHCPKAD